MKSIFFLIIIFFTGCTNHQRKVNDEILRQFDSVNKSLEKTNEQVNSSGKKVYDSIMKLIADEDGGKIRQVYYTTHNFYTYLDEIKKKFLVFCGDSSGISVPLDKEKNYELANQFFMDTNRISKNLFIQINKITKMLSDSAESESAKQLADEFYVKTAKQFERRESFMKNYFGNSTPYIALAWLEGFEFRIREVERNIYSDYFKKYKK